MNPSQTLANLVTAAEAAGGRRDWPVVRSLLDDIHRGRAAPHYAAEVAGDPGLLARIRRLVLRSAPYWWATLQCRSACLRPLAPGDASFYRRCFDDREFARRYTREPGWSGDLESAIRKAAGASPYDTGAVRWSILDSSGNAVGLASLTGLHFRNRNAEFSIGFPTPAAPATTVASALLVLHFAFAHARLNRLTAFVYADNPPAVANALHLGFVQEGLMAEHVRGESGEFIDLVVLGLTRNRLLANGRLLRLGRRMLGVDWARVLPGVGVDSG